MGMCDFPTGYYPPGQLSKNHGSTDRQHLVQSEYKKQKCSKSGKSRIYAKINKHPPPEIS